MGDQEFQDRPFARREIDGQRAVTHLALAAVDHQFTALDEVATLRPVLPSHQAMATRHEFTRMERPHEMVVATVFERRDAGIHVSRIRDGEHAHAHAPAAQAAQPA